MVHSIDEDNSTVSLICVSCDEPQEITKAFNKTPYFNNYVEWRCLSCGHMQEERVIFSLAGEFLPLGYVPSRFGMEFK